jgi:S1-C subfamily serine protease
MVPTARSSSRFAAPFHAVLRLPFGVRLVLVIGLGVLIGFALDNPRRNLVPAVLTQARSLLATGAVPRFSGRTATRETPQESAPTYHRPLLTALPADALAGMDTLPAGMDDSVRAGTLDREGAEEGTLEGVRVFPGRNRSAFARLGLHPGDLVTAVNGGEVSGDADLQQMLQGGGSVTLYRAGQLQTVTVQPLPADESDDAGSADP